MSLEDLTKKNLTKLSEFEQILGYNFTDMSLLQNALIHSSYAFEHAHVRKTNNETLEFIGDAVLDLTIGHILYKKFPNMKEGQLTKLRASLVNEANLFTMSNDIELGRFILLGKGEEASNGRNKSSILSCAYEAVVGAIFEDSDFETVSKLVKTLFETAIGRQKKVFLLADAKSRLQEKLQEKYGEAPTYKLIKEEGLAHEKIFTISVIFKGNVLGTSSARSKKEAEQKAAGIALGD